MRRLLLALSLLLVVQIAGATTIGSENVTVDLVDRTARVDIKVNELTQSKFSYITSYRVNDVEAVSNGTRLACNVRHLEIGSEIKCDPPSRENFSLTVRFETSGLVSQAGQNRIFRYSQSVYRPTENYRLKVVLPEGYGVLRGENVSTAVINPAGATVGSNGRRIFVLWEVEPELGETLQFKLIYERFSDVRNYARYLAPAFLAGVAALLLYISYRRFNREDVESLYEELSADEVEVLELLRENGGEMLQKDVVSETDYSKAKISSIVSGLVEEEIVSKKKEGRSNKLAISRNFRT